MRKPAALWLGYLGQELILRFVITAAHHASK
jgi:hypothetical protein